MLPAVNFRSLEVYQLAVRFLPVAAGLADVLPSRYSSLADQLRRASVSSSLNIAEGSGNNTAADHRRYYSIARGSAMECAAVVDACAACD
jgi:four helix bundle protein